MQLLHPSPTLDQGSSQQLINNLGLNMSVPFLGGDTEPVVWEAYSARQPVLFHHWGPTNGVLGLPMSHFTRVRLPPIASGCNVAYTASLQAPMDCDFPHVRLMKVGGPGLEGMPDVEYFLNRFVIREKDIEQLSQYGNQHDYPVLACSWAQENREVWVTWFHGYVDFGSMLPRGWSWYVLAAVVQFVLGLAIFVVNSKKFRRDVLHGGRLSQLKTNRLAKLRKSMQDDQILLADTDGQERRPYFRIADRQDQGATAQLCGLQDMDFFQHYRSEENFTRPIQDGAVPPPYSSYAFRRSAWSRMALLRYLLWTELNRGILKALATGLWASALSSLIACGKERYNEDAERLGADNWETAFGPTVRTFVLVYSSYAALPTFLCVIILNGELQRWLHVVKSVINLSTIFRSISLPLQGAFKDPTPGGRAIIFRFYRYLNLLHLTAYTNADPRLATLTKVDLISAGLLTPEEATGFRPKCDIGMQVPNQDWVLGPS